jgi:hypothetical protein
MKDEAELPKISGVPKSVRNRLGDEVNDVQQPNKSIVKKNSPANARRSGTFVSVKRKNQGGST